MRAVNNALANVINEGTTKRELFDTVLNELLDMDAGARFLGEFSFATNRGIQRHTKNILFDEKIFGSIHLTPGQAYDECDNGNRSAVHWDLVRILNDGEIWFDDVLIQKNGRFVHRDLLSLNPEK